VVVVPAAEVPESAGEAINVSMVRRYPARCLAYAVVIVASIAAAVWCLNSGYNLMAAVPGGVLLYLLVHVGAWWLRMRNTTLLVTDRRIVVETGLFTRHRTEFALKDVSDVLVAQDPIMRLFDVGDLVIRGDKGGHKEIVLMAVPHPDLVVQKITPTPPAPAQAAAEETTSAA
jgi:membrane protein YdbS with pleckstrin-like domain